MFTAYTWFNYGLIQTRIQCVVVFRLSSVSYSCPPEPKRQAITGSLTSSVIEEFFKDADVYQVSDEEQSQEPPMARQSEKETIILSSFDRYVTCFSLISFLFNFISVHCKFGFRFTICLKFGSLY